MKLAHMGLKWKDAINAIIMMIIGQALLIIMQAADGEFPSLNEFKIGILASVKYAVIPYILKNFFTDDIKGAQKTLAAAKTEGKEAASPIPPVSQQEKVDISKFPPSGTVPGQPEGKI